MTEKEIPIANEYLKSISNIEEIDTKDFFYSRVIHRLAIEQQQKQWNFPLKPTWMITTLVVLLVVNTIILVQKKKNSPAQSVSIQNFAAAYHQNINFSY